ncbi:hypothetical protein DSO57_1009933 [Entomophthora muscae]|uniref:Uncharacterized protein n=1 Tax=Entomophthora muscae TaxID=34485 RepID=A0ACC2TH76_9FUNG|nr:hypothetical protein DSO57_1009933 [Entomophthora muscae]
MAPLIIDSYTPPVKEKLFTIIDNKAYDITDFVQEHPGGAVIMTQLGIDATEAFHCFHPSSTQEILSDYYDAELTKKLGLAELKESDSSFLKDVRALKEQVAKEGLFKSNLLFFLLLGLSNLGIFGLSLAILYIFGGHFLGVIASAMLLGLFFQQCGWHAHEYLHHQVFESRVMNNWVGGYFFGAICQGFSPLWWKDKHNTHHAAPNVYTRDPDIDTHPFLAWSENAMELYSELNDQELGSQLKKFMLHNQPILFFPLLAIARLSWCTYSMWFALSNGQLGDSKKMFVPVSPIEPACLFLHWIIYSWIAVSLPGSWMLSLLFVFVSQVTCGILLASVFTLNHNGMRVVTSEDAAKMDFYTLQCETGRDVHPSYFMTWFCGGLNYQIEHHMFPTLPRHNFSLVSNRVRDLCKKHGVSYHCTGFYEGTMEVLARLDRVAKTIEKGLKDAPHQD